MSAGIFVRSRYGASYGDGLAIHPIRVQEETLLAEGGGVINNPAAGAVNNPISAKVSLGKRSRGLTPRYVTIQFPLTGQPTGYKAGGTTRIPALTEGFFAAQTVGAEITYLSTACTVVSTSPESAD